MMSPPIPPDVWAKLDAGLQRKILDIRPAHLAGLDREHVAALADYSRALGAAFRLTEDMSRLARAAQPADDAATAGLRDGALSHSVLGALRHTPEGRLANLIRRERLTDADVDEVVGIVEESGAFDVTGALARDHADRAATSSPGCWNILRAHRVSR
ncbi:hypothetical protein ACFVAV_14475 [Nocardia sp. NPDC057663]|uniref:hypothetical protein n=1 Tax=Nocardia sp. NPDC057663 TaxID=3346201 RepID=UPI00367288CA